MEKREIRRACWNGSVPVCFRLSVKDTAAGAEAPMPLYVMVPRLSYFPMIFDRVKSHFLGVVPTALDEIWLESAAGEPLRWHLAVGVLFDLCSGGAVPWQVTVHFSSFPEDRLVRLSGLEAVKQQFMSNLKEANFLKHGDGSKVMSLSRSDQDSLWLSIGLASDAAPQQFWEAADKLLPSEPSQLRSLAFRVFCGGQAAPKQLPLRPLNEDGSPRTLGQALAAFGCAAAAAPRVQGIVVPLEASCYDLQLTMQHCDGWVYVAVDGGDAAGERK